MYQCDRNRKECDGAAEQSRRHRVSGRTPSEFAPPGLIFVRYADCLHIMQEYHAMDDSPATGAHSSTHKVSVQVVVT